MKIGFFDSGIGGITVLKEALRQGINAEFVYVADNKNTPYGIKEKGEVKEYIYNNIKYLVEIGCDVIVIACNTATALCIKDLRRKFKNICFIGTEPAIKVATEDKDKRRILVTATTITLKEEKLKNLITNLHIADKTDLLPLDKLVILAENGSSKKEVEKYLKEVLSKYTLSQYSHIVLGCTHFPLFKEEFEKVAPDLKIIDGNKGIIKNLKVKISNLNLKETSLKITLALTKKDDKFVNNFKCFLNQEIDIVIHI